MKKLEIEQDFDAIEKGLPDGKTLIDFKTAIAGVEVQMHFVKVALPDEDAPNMPRNQYRIQMARNGKKISFAFTGSNVDYEAARNPSLHDIMTVVALEFNCPDSFKGFCSEFDYSEDSRKAEKTYKACRAMSEKLHAIFTQEEIEAFPQ